MREKINEYLESRNDEKRLAFIEDCNIEQDSLITLNRLIDEYNLAKEYEDDLVSSLVIVIDYLIDCYFA